MNQSHVHIHLLPLEPPSHPPSHPLSHPPRASRSTEPSSLPFMAGSHWLAVLHTAVYICQCFPLCCSQWKKMSPLLRWWPWDEQYGDPGAEDLLGDGEKPEYIAGVGAEWNPNPHPLHPALCFSKWAHCSSLCCFMRMGYGFPPLTEDGTEAHWEPVTHSASLSKYGILGAYSWLGDCVMCEIMSLLHGVVVL